MRTGHFLSLHPHSSRDIDFRMVMTESLLAGDKASLSISMIEGTRALSELHSH